MNNPYQEDYPMQHVKYQDLRESSAHASQLLILSSNKRCGAKVLDFTTGEAVPSQHGYRFKWRWSSPLRTVEDLRDFALAQLGKPNEYVVMGAPKADIWPEGCWGRRLSVSSKSQQATLVDRYVSVCAIDLDHLPKSVGEAFEPAIKHAMAERLPGIGFVAIASGSYQDSKPELSARVLVRVDPAVSLGCLKSFFSGVDGADTSIYQPQQPVYMAAPVVEEDGVEVPDPMGTRRVVMVEGHALRVSARDEGAVEPVDIGELLVAKDWNPYFKSALEHCHVIGRGANGHFNIECPWDSGHSMKSSDSATQLMVPTTEFPEGKFSCLHESCKGRTLVDVYEELLGETGFELDALPVIKDKEGVPIGAPRIGPDESWRTALDALLSDYVWLPYLDRVGDRHSRRLMKPSAFAAHTANLPGRPPQGNARVPTPVHKLWLADTARLDGDGLCYEPGESWLVEVAGDDGSGRSDFNLWRPSTVMSRAQLYLDSGGDVLLLDGSLWDYLQDHVGRLYGDQDWTFFDYHAHAFQRPWERPQFCQLHISVDVQGTGRGLLKQTLTGLYGAANVRNVSFDKLAGRFNDFMASHLVVCDEIFEKKGRDDARERTGRQLHELITESRIGIETKGLPIQDMAIRTRLAFFSNHLDAISTNAGDRRYQVILYEGAPMTRGARNAAYALIDPRSAGYTERMTRVACELLRREIRLDVMGRAPGSEDDEMGEGRVWRASAKQRMVVAGLSPAARVAFEVIEKLRDGGLVCLEKGLFRKCFYAMVSDRDAADLGIFLSHGHAEHAADEAFEAATTGRKLRTGGTPAPRKRFEIPGTRRISNERLYGNLLKGAELPDGLRKVGVTLGEVEAYLVEQAELMLRLIKEG